MAHLYRNTVHRYVDADGKRCRKDSPGARKTVEKSKAWYGRYRDADGIEHRVKLATDKTIARQMLHELERKSLQQSAGLVDPFEAWHIAPLTEHVDDFIGTLRDAGRKPDYCQLIETRVRRIVDGCKFRFIPDISASRVQRELGKLKRDGLGQKTVNHYLTAVKQFAGWLVADRRTGDNRLAHLKAGNEKKDIRRVRRELTTEEIRHLLETARRERPIRHLTGWERFTLYSVAIGTGFRASELASLTPAHFDLNGADIGVPTVRIDAADEKAGRGDLIPLPAELVLMLQPWFAEFTKTDRLWPGEWAAKHEGSKLIEYDLRKARAAWIEAADSDDERETRERSDFLRYSTEDGTADFHALRHTYLSRLGRSGASAKAMQKLARHTTVELTIGRYTHANLYDLAAAVEGLPPLLSAPESDRPEADSAALRATGTTGAAEWPAVRPDAVVSSDQNSHVHSVPITEHRETPADVVGRMVGQKVGQPADFDRPRLRVIEAPDADEPTSDSVDSARQNPLPGNGFESVSESLRVAENGKREWMGIELVRIHRGNQHFLKHAVQNAVQSLRRSVLTTPIWTG
ncbi:tyrosine-type recombinase/integrase [bacterium]|nr:tyrosine-type recombinase/integrase [bacterium]